MTKGDQAEERNGDYEESRISIAQRGELVDTEHGIAMASLGEQAYRSGSVACVTVAGGQGSRLGWRGPKGTFPCGEQQKTIYQFHAGKIKRLSERYDISVPWILMTSSHTHQATQDYFEQHAFLGIPQESIHFVEQGNVPVLSRESREPLVAGGQPVVAPNGHGGFLVSAVVYDVLRGLYNRGIRHLIYNQVDNLLCRYDDPLFLGYRMQAAVAVAMKLFCKRIPEERLGTLLRYRGIDCILEYSEIPMGIAAERDTAGGLRFGLGSPSMYCFSLESLIDSWSDFLPLPIHYVEKMVPCSTGVVPALKAERYIHDAFGRVLSFAGLVVDPDDEFAPIKGLTGEESVEDAPMRLSRAYRRWLAEAEITVGDDWRIEMDPALFSVAEDVCEKKERLLSRARLYPERKVMYFG